MQMQITDAAASDNLRITQSYEYSCIDKSFKRKSFIATFM